MESGPRPKRGRIRGALTKGISLIGKIVTTIIYSISRIWKPIVFIIGFGLIVFLSILWILSIIGFFYAFPFTSYFFGGSRILSFLSVTNVLVVIGVPLLTVIFYCIRKVFSHKVAPQWRSGMWTIWAVNLVSLMFIANFVWREFNQRTKQEIMLTEFSPTEDIINITLGESHSDDALNRIGELLVVGDEMLSEDIDLHILKSDDNRFELTQWNYSRGRNQKESDRLIEKINYPISIENNQLILPPNFSIPQGTKWRGQKISIDLKIPEGKLVYLDKELHHINVWVDKDRSADQPGRLTGRTWSMQAEGMVCPEYIAETNFQKQWPAKDFTKVQVEGRIEVIINKGKSFAVNVKGQQEDAEEVEVFKIGNTLNVTADFHHHRHHRNGPVVLDIVMPSLKELDVEDTREVEIRGFKEKSMAIRHEGSKGIKAFIDVDSLTIRQEGYNTMDISGDGRFLEANVSDGSRLNTERFPVQVADLKASDRGFVKANVLKLLYREVDGRSRVEVEGDPQIQLTEGERLEQEALQQEREQQEREGEQREQEQQMD